MAPCLVQGAPVNRAGAEAESETGPAGEWSFGGSEWVAHFSVLTFVGRAPIVRFETSRYIGNYRDATKYIEVFSLNCR
ncbi:hypothetical protein MTY59_22630 [Mycobacterium senriense]|uniref:Uncharacterized protein n=1 Tax=Mycobacterium senriense TaxID=2775496 RepID=A0ABN6IHH7_9MYCO|nr:hypothetical protein MTY59_22630 [Mycobacterium senriense]